MRESISVFIFKGSVSEKERNVYNLFKQVKISYQLLVTSYLGFFAWCTSKKVWLNLTYFEFNPSDFRRQWLLAQLVCCLVR